MTYLKTQDIAAIALCTAFWGVLNLTLAPLIWQMTHLPFTCDLLGFVSLTLVAWWTRRFGAASLTGLLVAGLTLSLRPNAFYMFGFIAASISFDILIRLVGYHNSFDKPLLSIVSIISFSTICAGLAGLIIGRFFLEFPVALEWFAGMHAIGGFIGGIVGVTIIRALVARKVMPSHIR
ncbi:hypothetical protein DRO69_01245 [Candidatus Bathyarchaeota archaeon]|nr:MAG: hypothetical protein DRO69_01245 [Candidatus Bathyarchaeota archaeon]